MNTITMKLQADHLIEEALREDISSEDVTTNSVMKEAVQGEVNLMQTRWNHSRSGCVPACLNFRRKNKGTIL